MKSTHTPFKRGISPDLLLSQVKNTMPYLFDSGHEKEGLLEFLPAKVVVEFDKNSDLELSHFEYFRLCLSAHYLTCGTPVPTDVDNQIRLKLWPKDLPLETAIQMTDLVLASRSWNFPLVSARHTFGAAGGPYEKKVISGHLGEWFTVACAAYCALKQYPSEVAKQKRNEVSDSISQEVSEHSEVFGSLWRNQDGISCLKTSANIAHNLGDLDRVMDMWELAIDDPLRLGFYKLTATPFDSNKNLRYLGRLWVAGELYKSVIDGSSMAFENHRHFALRKPRVLRTSRKFLIPNGPFFDDWGKTIAQSLTQDGEATDPILEVVEALVHGWERLPATIGYGRALKGVLDICPKIPLENLKTKKQFWNKLDLPQDQFEKRWNEKALQELDDIPSRA